MFVISKHICAHICIQSYNLFKNLDFFAVLNFIKKRIVFRFAKVLPVFFLCPSGGTKGNSGLSSH